MKKIVVLYHVDCSDGFGAAWVAWLKFKNKAEYIGLPAQQRPLPKKLRNKEIYILDKSFSVPVLKKLVRENRKVMVIDHHISRKKDTLSFPQNIFDNNHSAAVLTWKYFFPQRPVPKLLLHVEDIDLWRFKMKNTKEIMAIVSLHPYEFESYEKISKAISNEKAFKKLIAQGKLLLNYEKELIRRQLRLAYPVDFLGYKTLAVNTHALHSETAHELLLKQPPLAIVWYEVGKGRRISLRSNGKVDVSKIAKKFGGGGHKRAAGFWWPVNKKFPWKIITPVRNKPPQAAAAVPAAGRISNGVKNFHGK